LPSCHPVTSPKCVSVWTPGAQSSASTPACHPPQGVCECLHTRGACSMHPSCMDRPPGGGGSSGMPCCVLQQDMRLVHVGVGTHLSHTTHTRPPALDAKLGAPHKQGWYSVLQRLCVRLMHSACPANLLTQHNPLQHCHTHCSVPPPHSTQHAWRKDWSASPNSVLTTTTSNSPILSQLHGTRRIAHATRASPVQETKRMQGVGPDGTPGHAWLPAGCSRCPPGGQHMQKRARYVGGPCNAAHSMCMVHFRHSNTEPAAQTGAQHGTWNTPSPPLRTHPTQDSHVPLHRVDSHPPTQYISHLHHHSTCSWEPLLTPPETLALRAAEDRWQPLTHAVPVTSRHMGDCHQADTPVSPAHRPWVFTLLAQQAWCTRLSAVGP
jgi:hypothetical protein